MDNFCRDPHKWFLHGSHILSAPRAVPLQILLLEARPAGQHPSSSHLHCFPLSSHVKVCRTGRLGPTERSMLRLISKTTQLKASPFSTNHIQHSVESWSTLQLVSYPRRPKPTLPTKVVNLCVPSSLNLNSIYMCVYILFIYLFILGDESCNLLLSLLLHFPPPQNQHLEFAVKISRGSEKPKNTQNCHPRLHMVD